MIIRRSLHRLGISWEVDDFVVLFGNKHSNLPDLKDSFQNLKFAQLKQVHGDHAVESSNRNSEQILEADGHWTDCEDLALVIKTADCIPIFVLDPRNRCCAGIHAGWRGVAAEALKKTLALASKKMTSPPKDLFYFIGPHIQKNSFEIERTLAEAILKTVSQPHAYLQTDSGLKTYLDLNQIIRRQIIDFGGSPERILGEPIDTKTNTRFHSHRRDPGDGGRQHSFVARKKTST